MFKKSTFNLLLCVNLIIMEDNKSRLVTNSHYVHCNGGTNTSEVRLFPIFSDNADYTASVFAQFNDSIIQNVRSKRQLRLD
jgi:hypothetical protein